MEELSDIDIVVELNKPDLFYLVDIKQDLEEKFHRPVDIVRYRDRMNAFLKKRIDKEAVYVWQWACFRNFETDAEVIYDVCKNHIPKLAQTINKMIRELSQ